MTDQPDTRHPVLTLLARFLCRVISVPFLLFGALIVCRVPFDRGMPARIILLATMAGVLMLTTGYLILRFKPAKGPPIKFGRH